MEFKRHWFLQVQAGAAYTLGEVDFGKLVSPAAALYAGHRFSPVWGMRFGLSGWQSKGAWVSPESVYQYKYLQGNVDVTLDLANLFGKFNYRRTVNPYLFAGVGVNGAFDNGEANALDNQGYALQNVWSGSKVFVAGRLGLGVDFRFSDCVSFGVELNTNMLSDKYNSKKAGNLDWQFNALAGFTFRFGKNYKKSRPAATAAPVTPARTTEPAQKEEPPVQVPVTKAAEKPAALRENIFFRIGSAQIRTSEQAKVAALAEYLKANPSARSRDRRLCRCRYGFARPQPETLAAACRGRCSGIGTGRYRRRPHLCRGQGRHRPAVPRRRDRTVSAFVSPNKQGGAVSLAAADFLPPLFFALHFRLRRLFSRSTPVSCCPPRMSVLCVVLPFARLPVAIAPAVS